MNPRNVKLATPPGGEFTTDFVWFSLLSQSGCQIKMQVQYKEDELKHSISKKHSEIKPEYYEECDQY